MKYNPFNPKQVKIANLKKSEFTTQFRPELILYSDGSKQLLTP